jgi:UDP-glucose 4-epimerase
LSAGYSRYLIVGGAGFIGSHFTDRLLGDGGVEAVTLYDNFSSGREWHFQRHLDDPRLKVVPADVKDQDRLSETARRHDVVIHLASNPDIALAASQPAIDFDEGTALTYHVVEAMRVAGCRRLLYASGSGIYGDLGELEINEDHGPLVPISTYGASKLAGEALIAAYCHMFDFSACIFRFGNVVGPRQTHGVGFDFIRSLIAEPSRLDIQGDGRQSKSYIHVDDVVSAVLQANAGAAGKYNVFNVATDDYITVKEIADLAVECAGLNAGQVEYYFSGGERGWKGDVPVVRFDTGRIRKLGWKCRHSSRQALRRSLKALLEDVRAGNR